MRKTVELTEDEKAWQETIIHTGSVPIAKYKSFWERLFCLHNWEQIMTKKTKDGEEYCIMHCCKKCFKIKINP